MQAEKGNIRKLMWNQYAPGVKANINIGFAQEA